MNVIRRAQSILQSKPALVLLTTAAVLAVPALAMAIPGSGDFTSLDSPSGRDMTELYNLIAKICLVIFVIVCTVLAAAIVRFRRKSEDEMPEQIHGNTKLEVLLLVAASLIQIFIGVKTVDVMWDVEKIPKTTMTVRAIGYQWDWKFEYPDQGLVHEDLVIPAHTNVLLEITSQDVIHSLFVPELGIKMDAVPGRYNLWWVRADGPINQLNAEGKRMVAAEDVKPLPTTRPDGLIKTVLNAINFQEYDKGDYRTSGLEQRVTYLGASRKIEDTSPYAAYDAVEYRGMCTELCGKGHWDMYFRTVAMTQSSFEQWVKDKKTGGGEVNGEGIYTAKCASCHGEDGQGKIGQFPPLANSDYIKGEEGKARHINALLKGFNGEAIVVNGVTYKGAMQPWANVLNDEEIAAVINHERVSWDNNYGKVTAKEIAEAREALNLPPFPAGGADPVPDSELLSEGKRIYESCSGCHGVEGRGIPRAVPALRNNPAVMGDTANLIGILVNGQDSDKWPGAKPPIGNGMTNRELAAVISYIRTTWSKSKAKAIQPAIIAKVRKEVQK